MVREHKGHIQHGSTGVSLHGDDSLQRRNAPDKAATEAPDERGVVDNQQLFMRHKKVSSSHFSHHTPCSAILCMH